MARYTTICESVFYDDDNKIPKECLCEHDKCPL
jgi:hypothetical protein